LRSLAAIPFLAACFFETTARPPLRELTLARARRKLLGDYESLGRIEHCQAPARRPNKGGDWLERAKENQI
jgi:hypothetical protein